MLGTSVLIESADNVDATDDVDTKVDDDKPAARV